MKPLLLALALAGTFSASAVYAAPQTATNPALVAAPGPANGVAADVNGEKITLADLNKRIELIKASEPALQGNTPEAQTLLTGVRNQMLDQLITIRLLSQEAKKNKIVADPKNVEALVAQLKTRFKTDADFNAFLTGQGVSQGDLRARLSDELAMDELTTRITAAETVSPDDIAAYYRSNADQFTVPTTIRAQHILLAINPSASQADKDVVQKRAQNLIKQIKGGADFAALAKANSDDQSNKDKGGQLPLFTRGEMVPAFEKAAFDAKAGAIVGPVETNFGFHIIKINEVLPQSTVPLKDVQNDPQLKAVVLREKKQTKFNDFLTALKAKAKITKYV